MNQLPRNTILCGDAAEQLATLPPASIDCVVTSPPYFQLRDYGMSRQLGFEPDIHGWVAGLEAIFTELARVLKPTGGLWLNLGDSFSRHRRYGAPPKSLLLAPERLLLALAETGWLVRNKVIWAKPNPMPSSVGDRLTLTYEVVYFLVRNQRYFFDLDAIRQPHRSSRSRRSGADAPDRPGWLGPLAGSRRGLHQTIGHELGKNPGDVWRIATHGYRGAHFATFPEALVRPPILATCPEVICIRCEQPWRRRVYARRIGQVRSAGPRDRLVNRTGGRWETIRRVGGLVPCGCAAPTRPGVVLDPFFGTGTVGIVACELGRDWVGIELSPVYVRMAEDRLRLRQEPPRERGRPPEPTP